MNDQREINRHRMIPFVDQRLGEVERGDAGVLQKAVVEQYLVHAETWKRRTEIALEPNAQIISIEHRILGHLPKSVCSVAHHIRKRTHEHAHLTVKSLQSANRLLSFALLVLDQLEPVGAVHEPR